MIRYSIEKHAWGFPSKVLAGYGGGHIFNIRLTKDHDNTHLVGKGNWVAFDEYEEAEAPAFEGVIREQAANGNWYIEVTADTEALFVYDSPIIAEDYNSEFKKEGNFFNEAGKTVKAYTLVKYDIVEVSPEGFEGKPAKDATVSYADGKYVIA